ncbi:RAxF-45 family protein [Peribacillus alkalitolerans]|nr:RAxF-45 family protein [Peribacillus alkalitolerans]
MSRSVILREEQQFMYVIRAIFHGAKFQGGSLPFFRNCILKLKR